MKTIKAFKALTLKDGSVIEKGEAFNVSSVFSDTIGVFVRVRDGREMKLRFRSLLKAPSMTTLEKWSNDGIAKSVFGAQVEPDGYGLFGEPSWMLALGMI